MVIIGSKYTFPQEVCTDSGDCEQLGAQRRALRQLQHRRVRVGVHSLHPLPAQEHGDHPSVNHELPASRRFRCLEVRQAWERRTPKAKTLESLLKHKGVINPEDSSQHHALPLI